MGGGTGRANQFLVAAFVILTCLLAEYVNMLNTAKSLGRVKKAGWVAFSRASSFSFLFTNPN